MEETINIVESALYDIYAPALIRSFSDISQLVNNQSHPVVSW